MNYDQLVVLCTDKPVLYHVLMCGVEFMLSIDLEICEVVGVYMSYLTET